MATRVEYEAQVMGLYGDYLPVLRAQRDDILEGDRHGARVRRYRAALGRTERTLGHAKREPLRGKPRAEFDQDPYLRDIIERNLEVAAQCCIDICHRVIALENAVKPTSYQDAILRVGELGVLPPDFARHLAPLAGFRNILVQEYVSVDWDQVYRNLQQVDDLHRFGRLVRHWLEDRDASSP